MAGGAERESLETRRERARRIDEKLKELFPWAKIALEYGSDWELLVAVMLSAQCTDRKVNEVTRELFRKYRTLDDYADAAQEELERDIHSTGFFRSKAKNILAAARLIRERHGGRVPRTMEELTALPGVARKTANIVLGNAFGVVEGIAVDTHVGRLALKLGLTDQKDPDKIERDLMELLPREEWMPFTYRLIEYGRQVCPARRHDCAEHPLSKIVPEAAERWP